MQDEAAERPLGGARVEDGDAIIGKGETPARNKIRIVSADPSPTG